LPHAANLRIIVLQEPASLRRINDLRLKTIDLALVTGGANDLDYDTILNPREFPGAFLDEFDGRIQTIAHDDLLDLIRRVRMKCPSAVILVFGYPAPISYGSHKSKIRNFFKQEFDDPVRWWINRLVKVVDIEEMIVEAKTRSIWAADVHSIGCA
jgi:hypothetical protein